MLDPSNAIRNLLYLYTERFDLGDLSGAAELFRHARIITGDQGDSIDAEALLALWKKHVILYQETGTPRTKHQCTNAIVELDEGGLTASARSYYVVYQQTDTLPLQPIVAGNLRVGIQNAAASYCGQFIADCRDQLVKTFEYDSQMVSIQMTQIPE